MTRSIGLWPADHNTSGTVPATVAQCSVHLYCPVPAMSLEQIPSVPSHAPSLFSTRDGVKRKRDGVQLHIVQQTVVQGKNITAPSVSPVLKLSKCVNSLEQFVAQQGETGKMFSMRYCPSNSSLCSTWSLQVDEI